MAGLPRSSNFPIAVAITNVAITNVAITNVAITNVAITNVDITNVAITNVDITNVAITNVDITNVDIVIVDQGNRRDGNCGLYPLKFPPSAAAASAPGRSEVFWNYTLDGFSSATLSISAAVIWGVVNS